MSVKPWIKRIAAGLVGRLFAGPGWYADDKVRVLIRINKYFNEPSWKEVVESCLGGEAKSFQIKYAKNEFEFHYLLREATACFCFGIGRNTRLEATKLKQIYFGISGNEFLEHVVVPEGIKQDSCRGMSATAIAEYTVMAVLLLHRNGYRILQNELKRNWNQKAFMNKEYVPLTSKKIGILGVGENGRKVAEYFKRLGCTVHGYDIVKDGSEGNIDKWYEVDELDNILKDVDFVVCCLPLTPKTRHLLSIEKFKKMRPTSCFVNTSRGAIVNEKDLIIALKRGIIKGAVVDAVEREPLWFGSRLWRTPNLILTPHIAGNVNNFVRQIQLDFIEKIGYLARPG